MERRLAAILAADVVGYSRLVGMDEEGTLRRLSTYRKAIDKLVTKYRGRVFGSAGDSVVAEFASPVEAVRCAAEVQYECRRRNADLPEDRRMEFRIGVNLGDVVVEGDNLLGDGVNIAARLEELADTGGINVSDDIHRHVEGKLELDFLDIGSKNLKTIAKPVRVFQVQFNTDGQGTQMRPHEASPNPDMPAIAVLPFNNMSTEPEQEYFSDGLTEDIITALTHWRSFPVIARNSCFAYKNKPIDIKQVGRELGAKYLLEGSVRKGGARVRITAQLIDGANGHHIWAEKYDRELTDIFEVQDDIVQRIAALVAPELARAEIKRSTTKKSPKILGRGICACAEQRRSMNELPPEMLSRETCSSAPSPFDPTIRTPTAG